MAALSSKSAQEISDLLDAYGIRHGPVVGSTRALYEKKVREAMAKEKNSNPSSSDKTFYREEEEEVTYVTYRTPLQLRDEGSGYGRPYMQTRPENNERDFEDENTFSRSTSKFARGDYDVEPRIYDTPSTYRNIYSKPPPVESGRKEAPEEMKKPLIPLWIQFLVFMAVAVFLYLVFSNMESTNPDPFRGIE